MLKPRMRRLFISFCYIPSSQKQIGFGSRELEIPYPFQHNQTINDILQSCFKIEGEQAPQDACVLFWKFYDE
jgi:hypothetical protein